MISSSVIITMVMKKCTVVSNILFVQCWFDSQSTGLTAAAWFFTMTSPLPADGNGASLTCNGLALASVMYAALFDMI
jgi:hypothetical protein